MPRATLEAATTLLVVAPLILGCGRGPCDWKYVDPYFYADGGVDAAESEAFGERLDLGRPSVNGFAAPAILGAASSTRSLLRARTWSGARRATSVSSASNRRSNIKSSIKSDG